MLSRFIDILQGKLFLTCSIDKLRSKQIFIWLCSFLLCLLSSPLLAQTPANRPQTPASRDSLNLNLRQDTVTVNNGDTLRRKGDIQTTIKYSATDSVITEVGSQITRLYKDAKVTYGEITLEAAYMEVDMRRSEVYAAGVEDSTGKLVGIPKFKNGAEEYQSEAMKYNFKTKRAIIDKIVTQQGEGFVHGQTVKKDAENNMYVGGGLYTTCNLTHPHFHIRAGKIKVVHEKQIVTGPFNLVINDVPTPLGFAFGIFPFIKKKPNGSSGIIFPVYGEEPRDRGFFLRQGGYYWAASPYFGVSLLGEIYSRGGWGLNLQSQYKRRYSFGGNIDLRFSRRKSGEEGFQSTGEDFWVTWSHVPETRGTGRFSASVNAGTSTFNQRNAYSYGLTQDLSRRINPTFNSNVSYSNSLLKGAVTFGMNARHDMNTVTGVMNMTLPDLNVSVTRIFPFKRQNSVKKAWYETIGFSYQFNGSNRLTNSPLSAATSLAGIPIGNAPEQNDSVIGFNFANLPELWRRAQIGARHTIPVSMSLKLFKYFSLNPSFNYTETWYPQKLDYRFNPTDQTIIIDTLRGFHRSYTYNASAGLTTNIYGLFNINGKRIQAIRHRMTPNVGFSAQPDFSRDRFGFYQNVQIAGTYLTEPEKEQIRKISRFQNTTFGIPGQGRSGSVSFSLTNNFEAKLRPKTDSAGAKPEKVSIIDNFSLNTSYNLAADSLNLSPLNFAARTKILKTDINFNMTVDPYMYRMVNINGTSTAVKVNEFAWNNGKGLGQIVNAGMFFSKSFSPGGEKKRKIEPTEDMTETERDELDRINNNIDQYVDFTIPWSLSFAYSLNYSKPNVQKPIVSQTLSFNGDLKVTDKWKISFNSGYDFVNKGIISTTSLNIHRDLHCWEMVASWIPFGPFQSYTFDLRVKASMLQDLKLSRRRTWYDRAPVN
ncbi:putative LPS assembly protein LptD [Rhodocytophaga aerolata]|uniref:LPS assembly protein LptD n=1 Tax=Rhodocytophaga aerolata TaxID=455078 RepID=A0ABT8R9D2_9BACT|nr:putative LPS assembly protein LptD [Rhodocytophaga aerolata]MDO1447295.1 putative LPS assembly protein LptD [Rhodocytophaga aerolata]